MERTAPKSRVCFVCGGAYEPFLERSVLKLGVENLVYDRCVGCGFVISRSHLEMSDDRWQRLNTDYHRSYQGMDHNPDDLNWLPRLEAQARALVDLERAGLFPDAPMLDYGAGDGKLAARAAELGLELESFDRYMAKREGFLEEEDLEEASYGLVISCSVFEHVRSREPLDEMVSLLHPDGVLAVHTVVCETVPQDPAWFYYLPVHCAFFTNDSMQRLFEQWGFRSSFYLLSARLWFLCRKSLEELPQEVRVLLECEDWSTKNDFMDYWKAP